MQPLPHVYFVAAAGSAEGNVTLSSAGLPSLPSEPPPEFDGSGKHWSPESLLAAAVASCFILTFRSIARASRLQWSHVECRVQAKLERVAGVTQFTHVVTRAVLTVAPGTSTVLCERALTKAEESCLVANSLRCQRELEIELVRAPSDEPETEAV